jgi:cysteine-rich repeat protein
VVCGDGVIDPGEHCDDGNKSNLDGCDSVCKYEMFTRLYDADIVKGNTPSFCSNTPANRLGQALSSTAVSQLNTSLQTGITDGTTKMTVIAPGVDTSRFYPIPKDEAREAAGLPKGERTILFVGRLQPLKGVDTLIQAATRLRLRDISAEHPVNLVVVGGNPNGSGEDTATDRLQALTRDLCMDRMVVFLGQRDQDKLPYYYSAAEVVVMPSHYESFGMVALEAMACGTPVVASQVGGLAYLVQDGITGFVVPDQDPEALADRLTRLLGDPDLRQRMGQQAASYARTFDWENVAVQIAEVYDNVLGVSRAVSVGGEGRVEDWEAGRRHLSP